MKFLYLLILTFTLANSCAQEPIARVVYEASTRGNYYKIEVVENKITIHNNSGVDGGVSKKMIKEEWNTLKKLIQDINLSEIGTLERPTTQSYTDGALSATITVVTINKQYTSSPFDDGNPPQVLKKLEEKLLQLASM